MRERGREGENVVIRLANEFISVNWKVGKILVQRTGAQIIGCTQ